MITFFVPFKGFGRAKSRWTFHTEQRERVLLEILQHNLSTVASVVGHASTVLVCPEKDCFARFPAFAHLLSPGLGLNADLEFARQSLALQLENGAVAVLLPDLPQLTREDVEAMMQGSLNAAVTLCPDHRGVGTNGLVLNPAFCLEFLFEGESYERHRKRALELGLTVGVVARPGLADDADEEEDLRRMSRV